jgi:hypothetical protein
MMSLLDDARRLADTDHTPCEDGTGRCVFCSVGGFDVRVGKMIHGDTCPLLSMPRIVAALEAAERVAQVEPTYSYHSYGTEQISCLYCGGFEDARDSYRFIHETDCPRQALAVALQGDVVPPNRPVLTGTGPNA